MPKSMPIGLAFTEVMTGFVSKVKVDEPSPGYRDNEYQDHENAGRPGNPIRFVLTASVRDLGRFFEDRTHTLDWMR